MKKQDKEIDIEEDLKHQKNSWRFQRIGMAFLLILFIAFFIGLAGKGPLSKGASQNSTGDINIEYEKIVRYSSSIDLKISLKPSAVNDTIKIKFSKEFVDATVIQRIIPMPVEETTEQGEVVFVFLNDGGNVPLNIIFLYQMRTSGSVSSGIVINNNKFSISQFVLP